MLVYFLIGLIVSFFMALWNGCKLLFIVLAGKKCTMTIQNTHRKEVPTPGNEKTARYYYNVEVDVDGEKYTNHYEEELKMEDARELTPGTVRKMYYNRRRDVLYDFVGTRDKALVALICVAGFVVLFWLVSLL